jgi:hypothetical protein
VWEAARRESLCRFSFFQKQIFLCATHKKQGGAITMGEKKCNLEDLRGKVAPWLDAQHIRKISLIGKNRLSVLFMDKITDE